MVTNTMHVTSGFTFKKRNLEVASLTSHIESKVMEPQESHGTAGRQKRGLDQTDPNNSTYPLVIEHSYGKMAQL